MYWGLEAEEKGRGGSVFFVAVHGYRKKTLKNPWKRTTAVGLLSGTFTHYRTEHNQCIHHLHMQTEPESHVLHVSAILSSSCTWSDKLNRACAYVHPYLSSLGAGLSAHAPPPPTSFLGGAASNAVTMTYTVGPSYTSLTYLWRATLSHLPSHQRLHSVGQMGGSWQVWNTSTVGGSRCATCNCVHALDSPAAGLLLLFLLRLSSARLFRTALGTYDHARC